MRASCARCALAGTLAAMLSGAPVQAGDQDDVKAAVARAEKAYNECDADALAGITDARFFGFHPDGSLQEGNDTAQLKAQCDAGLKFDFDFKVLKVFEGGHWAVVAGANSGTITPPQGQPLPVSAHFTMVLVERGGVWRSIHVVSSSNE